MMVCMACPDDEGVDRSHGHPRALDDLIEHALPQLLAYVRLHAGDHLLRRESVHDLAQSVCRELLDDRDQFEFRGPEAFRKWLFLHASRKIASRARYAFRQKRDPRGERPGHFGVTDDEASSLATCYATVSTPSRFASAREQIERVEGALRRLPERQREAVTLAKIVGLPYRDIAARFDTTEAAVRALVARGLTELAFEIED